jgi:hypothetical protein
LGYRRVQSLGCESLGSGFGFRGWGVRVEIWGLGIRQSAPSPAKKIVVPVPFVLASSQKGLRSRKKTGGSENKSKRPQDLGEALVTECPYEAVRDSFFWPGLNCINKDTGADCLGVWGLGVRVRGYKIASIGSPLLRVPIKPRPKTVFPHPPGMGI